jgi:hypothetical protein
MLDQFSISGDQAEIRLDDNEFNGKLNRTGCEEVLRRLEPSRPSRYAPDVKEARSAWCVVVGRVSVAGWQSLGAANLGCNRNIATVGGAGGRDAGERPG